jgi:hypothetical protein
MPCALTLFYSSRPKASAKIENINCNTILSRKNIELKFTLLFVLSPYDFYRECKDTLSALQNNRSSGNNS